MILSDVLSRRPDHCPEEDESEEAILLPDSLFLNLLDLTLQDRIANAKDYDFDVTNAIAILLEEGPTGIRNNLEDWKIEEKDGKKILFYKGKNYIPKNQDLRQDILKMFHDHKTARCPGELETHNAVRQQFWWAAVKTEFIDIVTEGELLLSPISATFSTIVTEASFIKTPPIEGQLNKKSITTLYDEVFVNTISYQAFTENKLRPWENALEYKHFNTMYTNHQSLVNTIRKLCQQAQLLLEADILTGRDFILQQEIKTHVSKITKAKLCKRLCKLSHFCFVTSGSDWVRTSENESGVSRDLASAYVLCLCTFVVPNLQRDEGGSLGK